MKIYVYAICKNEGRFVHRWMQSMSEADGVYVLDTGSEDDSAEQLRAYGANVVSESVTPWRFDTARNRSLELVPQDADICVCTDLDEVFLPGWRAALEAAWKPGTNCAQYRYVWSFHGDGSEGTVFYICKVHARTGFAWKHPVHEVLVKTDGLPEVSVTVPGMQLNHYPDPAKSRASYLPLLEYSVQEDPADDRNMHYLGREYFYYGRWEACMETLKRHLQLPSATWCDERAASMRYIARASAQGCIFFAEQAVARVNAVKRRNRTWIMRAGCMKKKIGTAFCFLQKARCRSQTGRPLLSARQTPGAVCRGIFVRLVFIIPAGRPKLFIMQRPPAPPSPAANVCGKI